MDRLTATARSALMGRVRSSHTEPERRVRRILHRLGLRFRLHRRDLPGTPDIVLPRRRSVIFVHGCFWHRHDGCRRATVPVTNADRWLRKFARNIERDATAHEALADLGWEVLTVWECELKNEGELENRLRNLYLARDT